MPETTPGSSKTEPPRTKVVIRRLPPTLPEETFWNSVQTWVSENTCLWKRYVKGRAAEGNDGHAIFSRAYVLLSSVEAVAEFHRGYDGHVFRSKTGEEFQAVVELSPVQKTPYKAKVKVDARQGTIDSEPDYLSFLESLKAPPEKPVLEVSGPIAQPTTTPLLEHLRVHGRPGKGNKGKDKSTASSSDATARRAIASVNAAAAKRAPNANAGPILVAGKGREVTAAPSGASVGPEGSSAGEGKKKRTRGKGKAGGQPSNAEPTGGQSGKASQQGGRSNRPERSGPTPGEAAAGILPSPAQQTEGEKGGKAGRGGRGGKGREGKSEGKDRSAKAAVTSILTKNAEGEATRGGGAGRGRGRGRGGGGGGGGHVGGNRGPTGGSGALSNIPSAAASARIDG